MFSFSCHSYASTEEHETSGFKCKQARPVCGGGRPEVMEERRSQTEEPGTSAAGLP